MGIDLCVDAFDSSFDQPVGVGVGVVGTRARGRVVAGCVLLCASVRAGVVVVAHFVVS